MIKLKGMRVNELRSGVVAMAGHAVRLHQSLMKWGAALTRRDLHPLGRSQTYICDNMATDAPVDRNAMKRRMAGKAISLQRGMGRDEIAGAQHFVRAHEAQVNDHPQHQRQPNPDGVLHFHPQNRNVERMCSVARRPKAAAMGRWIVRHFLTHRAARLSQKS